MGVSSVIDDNNGKEKGNKEFNWVYVRKQSLNKSKGQVRSLPETEIFESI